MKVELGDLGFTLATKQRHLPVALTPNEVATVLSHMRGKTKLIIQMLYGSGLRVNECLRLRIQDISFDNLSVTVRDGKGNKDRQTLLSHSCVPELKKYINHALSIQQNDNENGYGPSLPYALGTKYPNAFRGSNWMFVFPSQTTCRHPNTGILCRHHQHDSTIRKALIAIRYRYSQYSRTARA